MIKEFALLNEEAEPLEAGVPHPARYLIDRQGVVRFVDVRRDFHIWLAPKRIVAELAKLPQRGGTGAFDRSSPKSARGGAGGVPWWDSVGAWGFAEEGRISPEPRTGR